VTFEAIEEGGAERFLEQLRGELVSGTYRPMRNRRQEIPKDGGKKVRVLSIPAIRDRVVQGALKLILEPIFEAQTKKRTALLRKLKAIFRRFQSQPVERVVKIINPILRGWVNYSAMGHSSRCFGYVRDRVEKKVRRHLMRARKLRGFGWKRWSRSWLYETLGVFGNYRVRQSWSAPKALPT